MQPRKKNVWREKGKREIGNHYLITMCVQRYINIIGI
jgi:hypothetical protein